MRSAQIEILSGSQFVQRGKKFAIKISGLYLPRSPAANRYT
jgi:hypothetical protein